MRWTTHIMTITLCALMVPAGAFAQQRSQTKRASVEHDSLTNADYTTSLDPDGNVRFTVKAGDFVLEKALDSSGTFTLRIQQGKDAVTIARDEAGYLVGRGSQSVRFDPRNANQGDARDTVRAILLGSTAVRSFRRLSLILENRDEREDESPAMVSTLLDGGLVQMLDGDAGAVPRIAKRMVRKMRAKLQTVKFMPSDMLRDCVTLYEYSILSAWDQYMQCMDWARNVNWWFQDWAEDFCHWEWLARGQSYLWQFISCSALPI
jgi:hypothetical protein